jgi:hypothetical protein
MTQTILAFNQHPQGSDVFGMVYPGAVHVKDLITVHSQRGSVQQLTRLELALALCTRVYHTWEHCFNRSRNDVHNGLRWWIMIKKASRLARGSVFVRLAPRI